ncbi:MAG: lysophospholipase [Deltaproteobacteria bacterium]|nr:lysophospholipase [Deltaproteobacteria bacterium]
MASETGIHQGHKGVPIHWRLDRPDGAGAPRALVLVSHGVAEHMGRYQHVSDALVAAGYAVARLDHRGHGASGGPRVFVERFGDYVTDLHAVLGVVKLRVGAPKTFLLGHSMGGLIAIHHLLAHPGAVDGAVVSGPALGLSLAVPAWKDALGKVMSTVWPKLAIPTGVDPGLVSRDPAVVSAYANDPQVTKKATARWYTELLAAQKDANERALELGGPLLVLVGGLDKLVSVSAIERWFPRVAAQDKTIIPYPALYHEVMNEPEKDVVLGDIRRWLDARS